MLRSKRIKSGFTLVELLVVIAIIGILIALLLPAVQAAREAARRSQCSNKMKQIGLALHNYHDTHKCFPPDAIWVGDSTANRQRNFTWIALLLPFMEQSALHDQIDFTIPAWDQQVPDSGSSTQALQAVQLEAFTCPSEADTTCNKGYGLSSYAGAAGWDGHRRMFGDTARAAAFSLMDSSDMARVKDGTSNTFFVGEVSMSSYTPAGASQWQGGGGKIRKGIDRVVRSCLVAPAAWHGWSHSWVTSAVGTSLLRAHDGSAGPIWVSGYTQNYVLHPVFYSQWTMNNNWPSAGSFHPGGAQFCLMDASVRFISDTIATGDPPGNNLGQNGNVWTALSSMNGGEIAEVP